MIESEHLKTFLLLFALLFIILKTLQTLFEVFSLILLLISQTLA